MGLSYLALDVGDRRTGVASGDDETGIASPLTVIERSPEGGLAAEVVKLVQLERPAAVVVGLPLNMDGSEGPRAKRTRDVAGLIRAALDRGGCEGVPIEFHDERLTSAQADWDMAQSGLTHKQKKARRDAIAAAAVLRDWLIAKDAAARGESKELESDD